MYSVGIDVSKGKSTVSMINEHGEIILDPKDFKHTKNDLDELIKSLKKHHFEDIKVIMEETGIYHHPILFYLKSKGYFCATINPLKMKKYINNLSFRGAKNDRKDSLSIAQYGIDNWYKLTESSIEYENVYESMRRLSRDYLTKIKAKVYLVQNLDHIIDQVSPGLKEEFKSTETLSNKDKLSDFIDVFYHYNLISKHSYSSFEKKYKSWAKKKGYRFISNKCKKIYTLAKNNIPTVPSDEITKNLVHSTVQALRSTNDALKQILTQLNSFAVNLPEYKVAISMPGVGEVLAPLLIAETGNLRRFHSADALVAFAGIDVPPYESGQFIATKRHITKKGSPNLRKILFQIMKCQIMCPPKIDTAVYSFMMKKKSEGKLFKTYMVAGMNKFLRIYYARVKELYLNLDNLD